MNNIFRNFVMERNRKMDSGCRRMRGQGQVLLYVGSFWSSDLQSVSYFRIT